MRGFFEDRNLARVLCPRCERQMLALRRWSGREVECPLCHSALRVPDSAAGAPPEILLRGAAPCLAVKRVFNVPCPRCGSLLEANTGMSGLRSRCPTCNAEMSVPFVDPQSGAPDVAALLDAEPTLPTALHAYAASGHLAPRIARRPDGEPCIICPRCGGESDVDANACEHCRAPFTLEGAATVGRIQRDGRSIAALVIGVLSLPLFPLLVPALLAILLGWQSWRASAGFGLPLLATAGMFCGVVSILIGGSIWLSRC